jgi:uncharacterized protein YjlB
MRHYQNLKHIAEVATGLRRPDWVDIVTCPRKPNLYCFEDDGETPNNPFYPLIHYRAAVKLDPDYDPAAIFEVLFKNYKWTGAWRDGVYEFNHFHTKTHEVLGIARGSVCVRFGGTKGRKIRLKAGDVIILPAGTGHRRIEASDDLLVVGAYPENGGKYDEPKPDAVDNKNARADIRRVKVPERDPVYGLEGPLTKNLERQKHKVTASVVYGSSACSIPPTTTKSGCYAPQPFSHASAFDSPPSVLVSRQPARHPKCKTRLLDCGSHLQLAAMPASDLERDVESKS